jgi:transcriptional regulator with XRE-family HTH domain
MARKDRHLPDLRLKVAIIESGRSQRRIALDTRIGEVRLSQIVRHRGAPATETEKQRLAKYLNRPELDLFPMEEVEEDDPIDRIPNVRRLP